MNIRESLAHLDNAHAYLCKRKNEVVFLSNDWHGYHQAMLILEDCIHILAALNERGGVV